MDTPKTEKTEVQSKLTILREKLFRKAKQEPKFRFYTLYGLIFRFDVLETSWDKVRSNGGSPGIDGVTFKMIEEAPGGVKGFLTLVRKELEEKTYRPQPVKRCFIPKPDGRLRPLGIPTIKDRVVQMATLLILEPIFEADFLDCSYGFRPKRNAHQAIREISRCLDWGYKEIYDADLQGYFDSIPHDKLMKCLEMRIKDSQILKLIKMWLRAPIVENENGKKKTSSSKFGTPQGGVISPLLANLYLHWFDKVFHKKDGLSKQAKLIRYCDDFVIMTKTFKDETKQFIEDKLETWLGLKINREKTRLVDMKKQESSFSFLGFTFRYEVSRYDKYKRYLNISPKKSAVAKAKERIKLLTSKEQNFKPCEEVINQLNCFLLGWGAYFALGNPSKIFGAINYFVGFRLYRHLLRRSQRRKFSTGKNTWYEFFKESGLVMLRKNIFTKDVKAKGEASRKAECGKSARLV